MARKREKFSLNGLEIVVSPPQRKILEIFAVPRTIAEVATVLSLKESTVEQTMIQMRALLESHGLRFNRVSVYMVERITENEDGRRGKKRNRRAHGGRDTHKENRAELRT